MTYDEILKLPFDEREKEMINFYINEISVLTWLMNDGKPQRIVFNDRIEYKKNNQYHNLNGAAIEYINGLSYYYINGVKYDSKESWSIDSTRILRVKKLKRLTNI